MNLKQITKDEDIVSITKDMNAKLVSQKFLLNKYTKNPDMYDKYKKDFFKRQVNREVIRLSFEEYLKMNNLNILVMSHEAVEIERKKFKIKFMNGEIIEAPLQYLNI